MKTIVIDGRLGKDAVLSTSKNGNQYLKFSVANTTYANGQEKTEWFDVTTFNENLIKVKTPVLKKGSYVIVTGTWESNTSVKDNKVWLNHYVTASDINVPNLGNKQQNTMAPKVETPSVATPHVNAPTIEIPSVEAKLNESTAVAANYASVDDSDDDLPF